MRPETMAAAARYLELARAHGLSGATLALAWCYSRWFVASTIVGATDLVQLKENIDALDVTLPGEALSAVERIHAEIHNPAQ
jgi:aryl-alcohol dehydrogenase-like predicted oxidoreductase